MVASLQYEEPFEYNFIVKVVFRDCPNGCPQHKMNMKTKITGITKVIKTGYQFRKKVEADSDGTHFYVQIRDFDENYTLTPDTLIKITPRQDAHKFLINKGDILFVARGHRNYAIAFTHDIEDTIAANYFFIIQPDLSKVLPEYLSWYINLEQGPAQGYLHNVARRGSHMPLISISAFRGMDIELPSLDKQQAIVKLNNLQKKERKLMESINTKRTSLINTVSLKAVRSDKKEEGDQYA